MSGSVNKVILIGNVGKDPEVRSMGSGDRVASFSLATNESWRDKSTGERKQKAEWHNVVIWNEALVGVVERYVTKGSVLYVEGKLKTRKWTDKNGAERYTTEVVIERFGGQLTMLGGKGDGDSEGRGQGRESYSDDRSGGGGEGGGYGAASGARGYSGGGPVNKTGPKESFPADLDDEIPF